ncbi:MAG: hypothetical protein M3542_04675, partial [Acidobacteriota bacterium]|nr:hypothetical protein [Acidobacteriota bacterium]
MPVRLTGFVPERLTGFVPERLTGLAPRVPSRGRSLRVALLALGAAALPSLATALPFWMRLPENVSTYGGQIDGLFYLILWITGVIFVIVEALLLFFLFRYRRREGVPARYTHGSNRLEVIWTIVPAVICVVLALMS